MLEKEVPLPASTCRDKEISLLQRTREDIERIAQRLDDLRELDDILQANPEIERALTLMRALNQY